jgi:hypothetical protein
MFLLSKGSPIFKNLAVTKLKLPDVLAKLSAGAFTGYASFVFQSSTAILVFEAGKLVSVLMEGENGKRESGVEAISTLTELMVTTGSGSLNVCKLSKDLTMSIHAFLEGDALRKARELKPIDVTPRLERVDEDQMNGCLRIYAAEHSTMILYKDGTLDFFHDGSRGIETSPSGPQLPAGLPGAEKEMPSSKSVDELIGTNLLGVTPIQKIWDTCVALHKAEFDQTNPEQKECDSNVVSLKRAELEERVKAIVSGYVGKVGRGIVDKEISDNGGNSCLLDADGGKKFMKNVERTAKLLASGTNIKRMMEKLSFVISSARSEL